MRLNGYIPEVRRGMWGLAEGHVGITDEGYVRIDRGVCAD